MAKEKKQLKKGSADFTLVGKAKLGKYTFTMNEKSKTSDWIYNRLNLGVDCGNGNVVYAGLMGGYGSDPERKNKLFVHGKKKVDENKYQDDFENKFEVAWEDRFDEKILENVGTMCFSRVGIEKDKDGKTFTKYFLSAYDLIKYLEENKELIQDKTIRVNGKLKYKEYNGNIQIAKEITSVYISNVEEENYESTFKQLILVDKYSIGKKDKETELIPIDAKVIDYVKEYNGNLVKTNMPYPITLFVENEKLLKVLKAKKGVTAITVVGDIIEGQAKAEIKYEDLDQDIKNLIDIGAYTEEEVIKKMKLKGESVNNWIIRKPDIRMVGKDDVKVPQIQREEEAYEEDDLILDFMIGTEDEEDEQEVEESSDEEFNDDDLDDFLDGIE